MDKFNLIGVRLFDNSILHSTKFFKIGKLKEAMDYSRDKEKWGFTYDFICCDKYGNYICDL